VHLRSPQPFTPAMPKRKKLTDFEKGQISTFHGLGWSNRRIASEIGRSHCVVNSYLSNPETYGTAKSPGRPSVLSPRDKRHIINLASNSMVSSARLKSDLNLPCTSRTVRNVLKNSEFIVHAKMNPCPKLTQVHKDTRLAFAERMIIENIDWNKVSLCIVILFNFGFRWSGLTKRNSTWF